MDPVTHGVVGAMAAYSFASIENSQKAAFTGFGAAILADVETFINLPSDPLFNLEIHRQFTHSLPFIPIGALLAAGLYWLILRNKLTFRQLFGFSFAGYATHWFMDVITSYGTELLWPFTNTRYAWNMISVVDPVLTAGLLLLMGFALWKNRKWLAVAAWLWLILILLTGWFQSQRAERSMTLLAEQRGHTVERSVVKPTIGNQLLWRATYISNGYVYTDAIRTGYISPVLIYQGESEPLVNISDEFQAHSGTTFYSDLQRFKRLSEGWLVRHPEKPDIIGDARYSMLPTSMTPLWGVETDTADTQTHLSFLYFRKSGPDVREPFLDMLLGKELE